MRRREFITLLGGALAVQAIPANAQEPVRVRTVGVLMGLANDAEAKARVKAFEQGLEREGWSVGQNLRIEYRYAEGDSVRMQAFAKELVELKLVASMARPEGNMTGFMIFPATIAGKYLATLKEMVPQLARAAILYNPDSAPATGTFFLPPFADAAKEFKIQPITAQVRNPAEIESAITKLGR